jgi:hypothetical protein
MEKWLDLGIWNEIGVETRFEKNIVLTYQLPQKNTGLDIWNQFGTDLDLANPNIWLSGHLDQTMNYGSYPLELS